MPILPSQLPNHAAKHKSAGGDSIKLDELAAPTDVATLNASTSAHGLLPKLDNDSAHFLNGQGSWATPAGGGGASPLTTKGDLYGYGTADARVPVEANNKVLTSDSSAASGVAWKDPLSGGVASIAQQVSAVPRMTSATTPEGVASASSYYGSAPPWRAFSDAPSGMGWVCNAEGVGPQPWIQYQFTSPKIIKSYAIQPWSTDTWNARAVDAWRFSGSNDGTNWVVLDTRTYNLQNWIQWGWDIFSVNNDTAYSYYRLTITGIGNNSGNPYPGVQQLKLFTSDRISNLIGSAKENNEIVDDFNNSSVNPLWTQDKGLSNAGTFTEDATKIIIAYPAGGSNVDWWGGVYNAPKLHRSTDMKRDFVVSGFFSNITALATTGGGILLYQSSSLSTYSRLGYFYDGNHKIYYQQNGSSTIASVTLSTPGYCWLKLVKIGSKLLAYYKNVPLANRPADDAWDYLGTADFSGDYEKMILAITASAVTNAVSLYVQQFKFEYLYSAYMVQTETLYPDPADRPPDVANAKDDEFPGTTLDAKWSWLYAGAPSGSGEGYSIARSRLTVTCGVDSNSDAAVGTDAHVLSQAVPSGEWTIQTKLSCIPRVNYHSPALFCDDGTANNINVWQLCAMPSSIVTKNNRRNGGSWTFDQFMGFAWGTPCFLGMRRNSSNVLTMMVSPDGFSWMDVGNWTAGWTPTRFGLMFWTHNTTQAMVPVVIDWFRVIQP